MAIDIEAKKSVKRTITQTSTNWEKFKKISDVYYSESKKKKRVGKKLKKAERTEKAEITIESSTSDSNKGVSKIRPETVLKSQVAPYLTKLLLGEKSPSEKDVLSAGKILAIDCEMVGLGKKGNINALARISIVNFYGTIILDTFVATDRPVTDYRTWVSGITPGNLKKAPTLEFVQTKVKKIIEGRILVGHDIQHDLKALKLSHPSQNQRDTAHYKPFYLENNSQKPSLKKLVKEHLGLDFQDGSHSSIEDALATLAIYRKFRHFWEASLGKKARDDFKKN